MNELDVLLDVACKLKSVGLQYMLTGSFAMNYYAEPRMTRDIDIVVELNTSDVQKIVNTFSEEYYISENAVKEAIEKSRMFNIIHNESVVKVDFVVRKNEDFRLAEFKRRKIIKINNTDIQIVSIEDLIISKLIWAKESASEMQKKDVKNLLNQSVDNEYLGTWIDKLELTSIYKGITSA